MTGSSQLTCPEGFCGGVDVSDHVLAKLNALDSEIVVAPIVTEHLAVPIAVMLPESIVGVPAKPQLYGVSRLEKFVSTLLKFVCELLAPPEGQLAPPPAPLP